jgi:hypothetical protein
MSLQAREHNPSYRRAASHIRGSSIGASVDDLSEPQCAHWCGTYTRGEATRGRGRDTTVPGKKAADVLPPLVTFEATVTNPKMARALRIPGEDGSMKTACVLVVWICFCGSAMAKDPVFYQKGVLLSMDSVSCGYDEKNGKTFAGQVLGTDSAHKKTKEMLCQEYLLRSEQVLYRIRPKAEKHPILLPVGEDAEFRIKKDLLLLKVRELDNKEKQYFVISMTPIEQRQQLSEKK